MAYYPRRASFNTSYDAYRLVAGVPAAFPIVGFVNVPCRLIQSDLFAGGLRPESFKVTTVTCSSLPPIIYLPVVVAPHEIKLDYKAGIALAIPTGSLPRFWIIQAWIATSSVPIYFRVSVANLPLPF